MGQQEHRADQEDLAYHAQGVDADEVRPAQGAVLNQGADQHGEGQRAELVDDGHQGRQHRVAGQLVHQPADDDLRLQQVERRPREDPAKNAQSAVPLSVGGVGPQGIRMGVLSWTCVTAHRVGRTSLPRGGHTS